MGEETVRELDTRTQGRIHAQRMETLGLLAAGIAHDFNNHLAAIVGQITLTLNDLQPDHPAYKRLAMVERTALRCGEISKQLLRLGRETTINPDTLNLSVFMEDFVQLIRHVLPTTIEISLHIGLGVQGVNADSTQLQQILLNLAINARDAMPNGGRIKIGCRRVTLDKLEVKEYHTGVKPGDYVEIYVEDNGHGIHQKLLDRIFEPFVTTKSTGRKGCGLGLSMVYSILQQHSGGIRVSSIPHECTSFNFVLPARQIDLQPTEPVDDQGPVIGNETVLVADDDEMVLSMVESALSMHGYSVITATNGLEALEAYRSNKNQIHLVLVDQTMPKLTGREVIYEISRMNPELPVILTSGYSKNNVVMISQGRQPHFIGKPYHVSELLLLLRTLLDEEPSTDLPQ